MKVCAKCLQHRPLSTHSCHQRNVRFRPIVDIAWLSDDREMEVRSALVLAIFLSSFTATAVRAQLVPEGVHKDATGPSEMCGLSGRNASELAERVRAAPNLRKMEVGTDRFEVYASENQFVQFALTLPTEAAYPAVTCRYVFEQNGEMLQKRSMRCDASRDACDRLFLEFQELDERLRQQFQK